MNKVPLEIIIPVFNEGEKVLKLMEHFQKNIKNNFRVLFCYDLDNDNIDDLLVRVEHSLVCGVGDCDKIDILLSGDITGIKAGILGGSKYYVSDRTKHGLRYLFFEMDCRSDVDEQDICAFYMLEPTSSEKYSGAILVQKGRKVE